MVVIAVLLSGVETIVGAEGEVEEGRGCIHDRSSRRRRGEVGNSAIDIAACRESVESIGLLCYVLCCVAMPLYPMPPVHLKQCPRVRDRLL